MNNTKINNVLPDLDKKTLHEIRATDAKRRAGDYNNSLPVVSVEIPASVVIDCPLVRPHKIQAMECQACAHFCGVVQAAWSDEAAIPWDAKYAIICAKPLERKTSMIVSIQK